MTMNNPAMWKYGVLRWTMTRHSRLHLLRITAEELLPTNAPRYCRGGAVGKNDERPHRFGWRFAICTRHGQTSWADWTEAVSKGRHDGRQSRVQRRRENVVPLHDRVVYLERSGT